MEGATAGNSSAQKEEDVMREFLKMLEIHFKGRRCYLGQYELNIMSSGEACNI